MHIVFQSINVVSVRSAQLISGPNGRSPLVRVLKSSKTTEKLLLSACLYSDNWNFTFKYVNRIAAFTKCFYQVFEVNDYLFLVRWTFPMVAVRWVSSLRFEIELYIKVIQFKFNLTFRSSLFFNFYNINTRKKV